MGFFSSAAREPETPRALNAKLENLETNWKRLDSVMRRTVGRLCLAAEGRSKLLDKELQSIQNLMRQNADAATIETALASLSKAITALDQQELAAKAKATVELRPAVTITPISPVAPAQAAPAVRTEVRTVAAPEDAKLRSALKAVQAREIQLRTGVLSALEQLRLFPQFKDFAVPFTRSTISEAAVADLVGLLLSMIAQVAQYTESLQKEKSQLEGVLQQADIRLAEMASYLQDEANAERDAEDSSQQLNRLVMTEVQELSEVAQRNDTTELKARVNTRLQAITRHLQDFHNREKERSSSKLDRTGIMRLRIQELEERSSSLNERLQQAQKRAMVDPLTKVANRAAYDERIAQEYSRWQRHGAPVCMLVWDIDLFKSINDTYGHAAGDKVLQAVGRYLATELRETDFVARYGGEEFVAILIGSTAEQAHQVAEKLRRGLSQLKIDYNGQSLAITASCGLATFHGTNCPEETFKKADTALYAAKRDGRNCCRIEI